MNPPTFRWLYVGRFLNNTCVAGYTMCQSLVAWPMTVALSS
jgi:hypothetical protein